MDIAAAFPTFVITLREGVEAALVVGIVLAYLQKAGQRRLNPWVYSGIGVGVGASVLVGVIFLLLMRWLEDASQQYAPVVKQLFEGGFSVAAIALLSWMLIWMTQQARALKAGVEEAVTGALKGDGAGWGVFGLIAIAVLREGFETVLFIAAQFQSGWLPVAGAIAGLVGAVGIGIALFQLGVKINLRRFFQVMGVLLLLIVSGLVVSALRHFDSAIHLLAQVEPAWANICPNSTGSCILGPQVWNLSGILPDRQFPGVILKAFFGYTQTLYLAQAIDYVLFLAIVGGIYWQSIRGRKGVEIRDKG
ncbi:FTR1 family iron permease [Oscillatoria sp. FACHB-1407]|uniref:FTR1 family iron permease n=1 Tax=Oscillatoria sp. FACHB-1407 TaxID=2692847 RepID=UPI001685675B|nr:FTR1 family protein [Oscillatoria sp. FACHB-1407]MBD2460680.1 FTR1 family iron permease [Oscillatoria sp. FACHB-1407]